MRLVTQLISPAGCGTGGVCLREISLDSVAPHGTGPGDLSRRYSLEGGTEEELLQGGIALR